MEPDYRAQVDYTVQVTDRGGLTTTRVMTRREKIKANRLARQEAYAKASPEERAEMDRKLAAKRASSRKHRKVDINSRAYRWNAAIGQARAAADKMDEACSDFNNAMEELRGLQEEYQGWYDNLPEGLQGSGTGEKLQAITELDLEDIESMADEATSKLDEAENAELPLGFGRD